MVGGARARAGDGAKGPRLCGGAYLPYRGAAPGRRRGLLARRSPAEPEDLAYHLTHAPGGTPLARLVRVAGTRRTIGACFEAAEGGAGLDHCEVRPWAGWPRHVTLAMPAQPASPCRAGPPSGRADEQALAAGPLPMTVPEVRRLPWRLVRDRPPGPDAVLRWSAWRRRHQQRARRAHWHRRTRHDEARL
jgi:hypothetical protein